MDVVDNLNWAPNAYIPVSCFSCHKEWMLPVNIAAEAEIGRMYKCPFCYSVNGFMVPREGRVCLK